MKRINPILLLLMFCCTTAIGQNNLPPVYEITTDTVDYIIDSSFVQVLPDAREKLTINNVSAPSGDNLFTPLPAFKEAENSQGKNYWIRFRLKNTAPGNAAISLVTGASKGDFYVIDSAGNIKHYKTGDEYNYKERDGIKASFSIPLVIAPGQTFTVYYKRYSRQPGLPAPLEVTIASTANLMAGVVADYEFKYFGGDYFFKGAVWGLLVLAALFNFFFFLVVKEKVYLHFSLFLVVYSVANNFFTWDVFFSGNYFARHIMYEATPIGLFFLLQFTRYYFKTFQFIPRWDKALITLQAILVIQFIWDMWLVGVWQLPDLLDQGLLLLAIVVLFITMLIMYKRSGAPGRFFLLAIAPLFCCLVLLICIQLGASVLNTNNDEFITKIQVWLEAWGDNLVSVTICWAVVVFSWALFTRHNAQRKEVVRQQLENERLAKEKEIERNQLIARQKVQLEDDVAARTAELKQSLEELKAAQKQLIQSEKMASLGELTAGIAHEIQNPLNFVNNFSEVTKELVEELRDERQKPVTEKDEALQDELLTDIHANLEKINHHGKRADAIVRGMLQHSRKSAGQLQLTDINALADEYLRLSYHGMRAKDKGFNANIKTDFDASIQKINIIPQDIGRVLLNIYNNAFYAVAEKAKVSPHPLKGGEETPTNNEANVAAYQPTVTVSTKLLGFPLGAGGLAITVTDNGAGIPQKIIDKIFQPFFTTKPTGQGTGLGLSLSYDIIKAHSGEIKVETKEAGPVGRGEGTTFIITLPVT